MSYTDDAVKAKLSALNETQEGIVTVAQWVMFHRRHAERTAQLWLQKLRDSPASKRLNLIYLANEVSQQSKARRKEDFLNAFAPIIAEAMAIAYKGASTDIQQKLRRVVEVWRQRSIFELPIQEAVEARVDELDKSRGTGKKPILGGSLFSNSAGSIPSEIQPLVPLQVALSKSSVTSSTASSTADTEYEKLNDPNATIPTPPVYAARLSQLLKVLANAENSVSESIKSRQALIEELEKLLQNNRSALSKDQSLATQLSERKVEIEAKKRDVEDSIMRGLSAENSPVEQLQADGERTSTPRPQVEALTPPPVEALTPLGSPKLEAQSEESRDVPTSLSLAAPGSADENASLNDSTSQSGNATLPGTDMLNLSRPYMQLPFGSPNGMNPKRRKVSHGEEEDYAKYASGDLDADVAELLGQVSKSQT